MDPFAVIEEHKMPFAELLGVRILSAAPERLTAEMVVRTISVHCPRSCMAER